MSTASSLIDKTPDLQSTAFTIPSSSHYRTIVKRYKNTSDTSWSEKKYYRKASYISKYPLQVLSEQDNHVAEEQIQRRDNTH
jgi:hypothetical protein